MNTCHGPTQEYCDALRAGSAGLVELEPRDDPSEIEAQLRSAAEYLGVTIVAGWIGGGRDLLVWRRWDGDPRGVRLIGIRPMNDLSPVSEAK